ncbi:GTP-binding protein [Candidatus Cloacimonadota bacterium]
MPSIRNIGIIAHVDAGKTTITEQMLYLTGELRKPGSVDAGTCATDNLNVERERGISVRSAAIRLEYMNTIFNLIDTPGHSDFSGEVERAIAVLDGAILVISAAEGIEAHTTLLWNYLQTLNIPTIIFINKIDRMNSDVEKVIEDIQTGLTRLIAVLQNPVNESNSDATISAIDFKNPGSSWFVDFCEKVAEHDDDLLAKYLDNEELKVEEILASFQASCQTSKLYPVLLGVAKNGVGIKELLTAIIKYLPAPIISATSELLAATVFKIQHDPIIGKLSFIRLFSGSINPRDQVYNATRNLDEKVNQIKYLSAQGWQNTAKLSAGEVGFVTGLKSAQIGDILGILETDKKPNLSVSPFIVQVIADDPANYAKLAEVLTILDVEEPNLNFDWDREEKQLSIEVMGYIHIQILQQTILDRFGFKVTLSEPAIIYKETPSKSAEGYEAYTMPKPCWAVCRFQIEPGEVGSGIVYKSEVSQDKIALKYQKEIERNIPKALLQGPKGWQITDIKITLIDGEDHEIHSRPGNFVIATNIALMGAFTAAGTTLLEPILLYSITIEEEKCGRVMSDIVRLRGSYETPEIVSGMALIKGIIPAATSLDYQLTLSSISAGKSAFRTSFHSYQKCITEDGVVRPYRGINPLDRSKYILKMRGAIKEGMS